MAKLDPRTKNDILAEMKEKASSYTPEWNPDTAKPDIAASLMIAGSEMLEGTIKKINSLPLKNQIAFYNMLNASLLPSTPSEGYVSFGLSSDDASPVEVPKGTVVSSYDRDDEPVNYETEDDVLVSPAAIVKSFIADDEDDHIGLYDDVTNKRTVLFSLPKENLQRHVLWIGHPYAFHVCSEADIALSFFHTGQAPLRTSELTELTHKEAVSIEYYAKDSGYIPFEAVSEKSGRLILHKGLGQPPVTADEEGFQLRMTVKDMSKLRDFCFRTVKSAPCASHIMPEAVTDGMTELERNSFFPFGERFSLFDEIYIGCSEVLDKRGAVITMSFDLRFVQVPIENQLPDDEIKWKWIAKKSDFKERASYILSITEVIWEYFNGSGWSRLFPDNSYSDIFTYTDGVVNCFRTMTFTCPEDIGEIFAGAQENYYIRAKVLKAENLYKLKGFFMSPFIRNLSFDYHYTENGRRVEQLSAYNCLEKQELDSIKDSELVPFFDTASGSRALYLGFSHPPENGPMRIMWDTEEEPSAKRAALLWHYWGEKGWKSLNMADETNSLTTVGLTVFLDNPGFARRRLFGEELYWIRLTDINNSYKKGEAGYPVINGISTNTVRARNVDSHHEEYFAMNVYTENALFRLASGGVLDIEVYVNEYRAISEAELGQLEKEDRVIKTTDETGIVTEVWVKWNEVPTFADVSKDSRCYTVDRSLGRLCFGNGRQGRIPSASDTENIRVSYTTGGGERTNVKKGAVTGMERSIGLVSTVSNPKQFYGGRDIEKLLAALKRNAVMLRTQGRAVTARDIEDLALCASRSVEKARAFGGRNMSGEAERGAVTLVVLKDSRASFSRVREELSAYLLPRIAGNIAASGSLYITEPTFIRLNVKAELAADSMSGIFDLKRSIDKCIADCIRAYTGDKSSNEWTLGRLPNEHQIRSAILRIPRILYIKSICITKFISRAGGLTETDDDAVRRLPFVLPVCGENDISIVQA